MDNAKYLFMITGAPGSGKSTLASNLRELAPKFVRPIAGVCEADGYWYILGKGKYAFNPKLLWKAHKWCQDNARELMSSGKNLVVSNTSMRPRDRAAYFEMADEFGYDVVYIHLKAKHGNIHDCPKEVVKRMEGNYMGLTLDEMEYVVPEDEFSAEIKVLMKLVQDKTDQKMDFGW